MAFSGFNGGNCVMSSIAKVRFEKGMIEGAEIVKSGDIYRVQFLGEGASWNEERLMLSSARQPYEARAFKSIDGAVSAIKKIGLKKATINLEPPK